jgi:hypothetical protein
MVDQMGDVRMEVSNSQLGFARALGLIGALLWSTLATQAEASPVALYPKVDCASWNAKTQDLFVVFGADNQTQSELFNPLNVMSPAPSEVPMAFTPGYSPAVFVFTFSLPNHDTVSWFLGQSDFYIQLPYPYSQVTYDNSTYQPVVKCPHSFKVPPMQIETKSIRRRGAN